MLLRKYVRQITVAVAILVLALILYFSFLSQSANDNIVTPTSETSQMQPVVSLDTILSVSDVEQALMQAAREDDLALIEKWQLEIIVVATEAGYSQQDMDFLTGKQGVEYLRFRGMRLLFQQAVKQAYRTGEGIEDLFRRYPQASDLFDQTEHLFTQRDRIIDSIAQTLIDSSQSLSQSEPQTENVLTDEQAKRAALEIWRERNAVDTSVSP